jgi:spermidine synthase
MNRAALFAVVSLSGASVLVLEILGSRVLGPYYGVSLFLWSTLIAVTLAALACGYALGGRWAMRNPSGARLSLALAVAGLWVLAVPWLRGPVANACDGLGLRGAMLASALLLFFPPLTLLGMVSPYAIQLGSRSVDEVGRVSGDLFAVSTLASVAAAVATGWALIPVLGVTRLLVAVALALFLAAAIARAASGAFGALVLLLAGAGLGNVAATQRTRLPAPVLAAVESPYASLRVIEWKGLRYLTIDGGVHTIVNAETEEPRQAYVYAAELAADFFPDRGRLLLVGLGGGGTARLFARRGWKVDAVEIDSSVAGLAERHFRLQPFHAKVIIADGRQYIRRSRESYEVVFFDAFGSASIPFHLVTREAFAEARARLAPGGIFVLNVETEGWQDPLAHALAATLRTQFRNVVALPTSEPPNALGNVVLLASDRPLELPDEALGDPVMSLEDEDDHFRVVTRHHAWENRYEPSRGRVLTDDWNPSDLRAEQINLAARKWLRTMFPDSVFSI